MMKRLLASIVLLALFAVPAHAQKIPNSQLADQAADTIKGRANGAGTGSPQNLSVSQVLDILGVSTFVRTVLDDVDAVTFRATIGVSYGSAAGTVTEGDKAALLAGRSGGQTLNGGTASGDDLTLDSTANATKGDLVLQPSGGNVGIGAVPGSSANLDIQATDATTYTATGITGPRVRIVNNSTTNNTGSAVYFSAYNGSTVFAGASVGGVFSSHTGSSEAADLVIQTKTAGALAESLRVMSGGHLRTPELSAPSTPASGFGYWYVGTDSLPHFTSDSGTDYDLSFSGGAYAPDAYFGGNMLMNWSAGAGTWTGETATTLQWWTIAANTTVTVVSCITEGIPDTYGKYAFKIVNGASGGGVKFTQRITVADHSILDNVTSPSVVVSAGWRVYQAAGTDTITGSLVDSAATSMGTDATTTNSSWVLLKVQNKAMASGVTYVDYGIADGSNSDTYYLQPAGFNRGAVLLPYADNPQICIYKRTNAVVSRDPANTNWNTASYAAATHPLCFMVGGVMNVSSTVAASSIGYMRPTFSAQGQETSTAVTRVAAANVGHYGRFEEFCDSSQQMDDSAGTSSVTLNEVSVTHYWRGMW